MWSFFNICGQLSEKKTKSWSHGFDGHACSWSILVARNVRSYACGCSWNCFLTTLWLWKKSPKFHTWTRTLQFQTCANEFPMNKFHTCARINQRRENNNSWWWFPTEGHLNCIYNYPGVSKFLLGLTCPFVHMWIFIIKLYFSLTKFNSSKV